jgi:TRAP-type mannitol/chloroaromatic compound transport system permease small subunit
MVSWLTLGMVLGTFAVAVLRYFLDIGATWLQEAVTWMHAMVFLGGASYALRHDEHVRVDVFYRHFSVRGRAWVAVVGVVALLWPFCGYLLAESWPYVAQSLRMGEGSREANGLPAVYVLKAVIPLSALLLSLQGLAMVLRAVALLRQPAPASSAAAAGASRGTG